MNLEQLRFKRTNEKGYIFNSSNGDVYELNETSSIIAEGFFNNNLEESMKAILEIYHVDENTLKNDVDDFCKFIREICE